MKLLSKQELASENEALRAKLAASEAEGAETKRLLSDLVNEIERIDRYYRFKPRSWFSRTFLP